MSFIFSLTPAVHEDLYICHLLSLSMTESLSRHITVWFKDRLHKAQRDAALRVKEKKSWFPFTLHLIHQSRRPLHISVSYKANVRVQADKITLVHTKRHFWIKTFEGFGLASVSQKKQRDCSFFAEICKSKRRVSVPSWFKFPLLRNWSGVLWRQISSSRVGIFPWLPPSLSPATVSWSEDMDSGS